MPILLATDLSIRAQGAADVAARLARAVDERLTVLHVPERRDASDELAREVDRLEQVARVELAVRLGPVVPAVADFAAETNPRYVVVGAQGSTERALLGTVATALAARLPMAVFVIRAAERWLPFFERRQKLRIVLADGRDETFVPARDTLIELSRLGEVEVTVVHAPEVDARLTADARARLERELVASVGPLPGVPIRVVIRDGAHDAKERLLAAVRELDPDLVVCGTHQRHGLRRLVEGSTSSFLTKEAPCSVVLSPLPAQ